MGIPRFNKWISENYPSCISDKMEKCDGILFDLNGLLHTSAQEYFKLDEKNTEEEAKSMYETFLNQEDLSMDRYMEVLVSNIESIIKKTEPIAKKKGPVKDIYPLSFIIFCIDGVPPLAKIIEQRRRRYDVGFKKDTLNKSLQLTTGTTFMRMLDVRFRKWVESYSAKNNRTKIIYSGHTIHGEGEHKMFKYLRELNVKLNNYTCVVGDDADLILLAAKNQLCKMSIYVNRTNTFLNTFKLRNMLFDELTSGVNRSVSYSNVIRDFVLITGLLGNDFIPALVSTKEVKDSLNIIIQTYSKLALNLTNSDGSIIWKNYAIYLRNLSRHESSLLVKRLEYKYKAPIFGLNDSLENPIYNGRKLSSAKVNMEKFEDLYYQNYYPIYKLDKSSIKKIIMYYFRMVQWYLFYYEGKVYGDYYYPYIYGPTINTLIKYINDYDPSTLLEEKSEMTNPLQHLFVFPPEASSITPYKEIETTLDNSDDYPLSFPKDFKRDLSGIPFTWKDDGKAILPPLSELYWIEKYRRLPDIEGNIFRA